MKTVLFNIQFDYRGHSGSGSAVRPGQIREAFEAEGYRVMEVTGHRKVRGEQVKVLLPQLPQLDPNTTLLYAESATFPHVFDQPSKLPGASPDLALARAAQKLGIRTGLFYRDMHWRFLKASTLKGKAIETLYRPYFKREIRDYAETYDVLFAPTLGLLNAAPETQGKRKVALPPAISDTQVQNAPNQAHRVIHVGGLTDATGLYDILPAVTGAANSAWEFTLVCRKGEWERAQNHYQPLAPNTRIVHATGADKNAELLQASIGALLYTPHPYRELAFPFKLLEYLQAGLPIVATGPSEAARFVTENGVGWSVESSSSAIAGLLDRLHKHPEQVEEMRARIPAVLQNHTWARRIATLEKHLLP